MPCGRSIQRNGHSENHLSNDVVQTISLVMESSRRFRCIPVIQPESRYFRNGSVSASGLKIWTTTSSLIQPLLSSSAASRCAGMRARKYPHGRVGAEAAYALDERWALLGKLELTASLRSQSAGASGTVLGLGTSPPTGWTTRKTGGAPTSVSKARSARASPPVILNASTETNGPTHWAYLTYRYDYRRHFFPCSRRRHGRRPGAKPPVESRPPSVSAVAWRCSPCYSDGRLHPPNSSRWNIESEMTAEGRWLPVA